MGILNRHPEKLVIVLMIALIVLGPKRLPEVGKFAGQGYPRVQGRDHEQSPRPGARAARAASGSEHHAASGVSGVHAAGTG